MKATIKTIAVSELLDMTNNGDIRTPEFQRSYVWNAKQAALLIDSLANGYPVPPLMLVNDLLVDGLQRLTSIKDSAEKLEAAGAEGHETLGKLNAAQITLYIFEVSADKEDEYARTAFSRLNNGKVLNAAQRNTASIPAAHMAVLTAYKAAFSAANTTWGKTTSDGVALMAAVACSNVTAASSSGATAAKWLTANKPANTPEFLPALIDALKDRAPEMRSGARVVMLTGAATVLKLKAADIPALIAAVTTADKGLSAALSDTANGKKATKARIDALVKVYRKANAKKQNAADGAELLEALKEV